MSATGDERQAPRPALLVVAFGTATGVGKTWCGARTLEALAAIGRSVGARKPVESFEPGESRDSEVLAAATGEAPDDVCPVHRRLGVPMAPPMAAEVLGVEPFGVDELLAELRWPEGVELGWLETVGGPRSPVAVDGDSVALAAALAPEATVLVADAALGAINAVELSLAAIGGLAPSEPIVLLNRFDPDDDLQRRNLAWLEARHHVLVSPEDLAVALDAQMEALAGDALAEPSAPLA